MMGTQKRAIKSTTYCSCFRIEVLPAGQRTTQLLPANTSASAMSPGRKHATKTGAGMTVKSCLIQLILAVHPLSIFYSNTPTETATYPDSDWHDTNVNDQ